MSIYRYFAQLLRVGMIVGVTFAAVAFPVAAMAGLATLSVTGFIEDMPSELSVIPPAQTSYLYANDNKTVITQFYEEYRKYTPLSSISTNIQRAIVASEDSRFYEHHGVDIKGVARAFVANQRAGGVSQGGSTLTMQYVRNVQRDSATSPQEVRAATAQTNNRKLREMRLAVAVEKKLTKEQILERYLNVAYFGHRAYGIYAAAEVYFSKPPSALNLAEAATLAGLVQAPTSYDPASDPDAAKQRRDYVVDRMLGLRYISADAAAAAKKQPIRLHLTDPPNDCAAVIHTYNSWGFFCDIFKNWWRSQPAFGKTPEQREENLRRGGYRIVSSLDPHAQSIADDKVRTKERVGSALALGLVAIQPGTGKIKAAVVNRRYSLDQKHNGPIYGSWNDPDSAPSNYPNTVVPLLGGGDMPGYQAGSTFKIFTMAAALESGMPLNTKIDSPRTFKSIYLAGSTGTGQCGIYWCPSNASAAMTGTQTMWSAFGKSVNTYFVQLEQRVGAQNAVRMAERLGLTWHTDVDRRMASPQHAGGWGSFTLGVADTTPLEMANAYATLAADGVYCAPSPVESITSISGEKVAAGDPQCHQEVSVQVARATMDAARCVTGYKAATGECGTWSTASSVYKMAGRPIAGKTGTTDSTRAAWFVGVTPDLAAASFIADPDNPNHVAGDGNSNKPVEAVAETIRDALQGTPKHDFVPPDRRTAQGRGLGN